MGLPYRGSARDRPACRAQQIEVAPPSAGDDASCALWRAAPYETTDRPHRLHPQGTKVEHDPAFTSRGVDLREAFHGSGRMGCRWTAPNPPGGFAVGGGDISGWLRSALGHVWRPPAAPRPLATLVTAPVAAGASAACAFHRLDAETWDGPGVTDVALRMHLRRAKALPLIPDLCSRRDLRLVLHPAWAPSTIRGRNAILAAATSSLSR